MQSLKMNSSNSDFLAPKPHSISRRESALPGGCLVKTYDSVFRDALFTILEQYCFGPKVLALLRSYYRDQNFVRICEVRFQRFRRCGGAAKRRLE